MQEIIKLLVGILFLFLAWPVGIFLAKITKEELKSGQKYFKIILWLSLVLGFAGLIFQNDYLLFTMFFIAIVTSKSILRN